MDFTTRDRSGAQEGRCSKYYGAVLNPNSGAVNNIALKGDLRNLTHSIECKCTEKRSITIKKEDIYNISNISKKNGKKWLMNFEFQKSDPDDLLNNPKNPEDNYYNLTLLPTDDFIEIYEIYKQYIEKEREPQHKAVDTEGFIVNIINTLSEKLRDEVKLKIRLTGLYLELQKYIK